MRKNPWVLALKQISEDPSSSVICPNCKERELTVSDYATGAESSVIERILSCPLCNAHVSARISCDKAHTRISGISEALQFTDAAYKDFF